MCHRLDVVDPLVEEVFKQTNPEEPLEAYLTHKATKEHENHHIAEYAFRFDLAAPSPYRGRSGVCVRNTVSTAQRKAKNKNFLSEA
ncbi:hypothetical protein ACOSP7_009867 [Xanthoceras sorbifolium]